MANLAFDSTGIDPAKPFEPLPPGDYPVIVTKSGFEPTKDGRGSFLKLELQVIDGAQKGRVLFDRINLNNPSEKAVEFARRQLAAVLAAIGKISIKDTEELHNLPMLVRVSVVPIEGKQGEYSNEVKGYLPMKGATAGGASTGGGTSSEGQQTEGENSLPWKR